MAQARSQAKDDADITKQKAHAAADDATDSPDGVAVGLSRA